MKRTRVKVCGIMRAADIAVLERESIDALGFILHPRSVRRLTSAAALKLRNQVPPTMLLFGVIDVRPVDDLLRLADRLRLDVLQLHGLVPNRTVAKIQREGYRVCVVWNPCQSEQWRQSLADIVTLDNSSVERAGGTGQPFAWESVRKPYPRHLMIAGGLNENNIQGAIRRFRPDYVDLNSGVESAPGKKSAEKLRAVLKRVRQIDTLDT